MKITTALAITLIATGLLFNTAYTTAYAEEHEHEHEHEQHGAHEHGVATLSLAIGKDGAEIQLESPAANLVGFEHTARTDEEKHKLLAATQTLQAGDKLFTLNSEAGCQLDNAEISTNIDGKTTKTDAHQSEESHSDMDVTWTYTCTNAAALKTVGVKLFSAFPQGFERIKAEWVTDKGASAAELTTDGDLNLQP